MKSRISRKRIERGSILITTLCVAFIIGVTLASYLTLVQSQSRSVARSQSWNSSLVVTEAGIEDALQFINKYAGTPILPNWTNNAPADNWSSNAAPVYRVHRTLGPVSYDVYVTNLAMGPTLYAVSRVQAPVSGQTLQRRIFVRTRRNPLFDYALAADGRIDLMGNNVTADSFDSNDNNASNNGIYDPSERKGSGDIVTNGSFTNSISAGNSDIMGHVRTGPNGTISVGPQGSIGSVQWVTNGNTGIESTNYVSSDMNVKFPQVDSPDQVYPVGPGAWVQSMPIAGTVGGVNYDHIYDTPGDNYYKQASPLNDRIYIGTNVNLVLWLKEGADLSGGDLITIAQGGALTIYTEKSFVMSGTASINNTTQRAQNFNLLGMRTCPTVELGGNGSITGCIYAPDSALILGGGGNNTYDFVGAGMAKTITLSGHMNFHFDEALKFSNFSRGFIASYWKEMP